MLWATWSSQTHLYTSFACTCSKLRTPLSISVRRWLYNSGKITCFVASLYKVLLHDWTDSADIDLVNKVNTSSCMIEFSILTWCECWVYVAETWKQRKKAEWEWPGQSELHSRSSSSATAWLGVIRLYTSLFFSVLSAIGTLQSQLGQLLTDRITPGMVYFEQVGVDYAGLILIKYGHTRRYIGVAMGQAGQAFALPILLLTAW